MNIIIQFPIAFYSPLIMLTATAHCAASAQEMYVLITVLICNQNIHKLTIYGTTDSATLWWLVPGYSNAETWGLRHAWGSWEYLPIFGPPQGVLYDGVLYTCRFRAGNVTARKIWRYLLLSKGY